ncbi:hypothetical protein [uncultured Legionella sp.]|uniref:hypothetical protein n=1 Tax=uncultured Legionella sp. TaxID=210934 RepID=UPI00261A3D8A|nr:hypothetical protein [uncultured Legionella sp.]
MHEKRERDRVTISLFSVETTEGFSDALLNQKDNIERMQKKMTDAAIAAGREPPEFVVSVLLVPDWKKAGNGYENASYKEKQAKFMETTRKHFSGVTVEDFYNKGRLTNSEKQFMNGLEALGSNADIIKNRAIINNQDRRHLQIDSNTQINDYYAFYAQTFGAPDEQQADALNASYYDKNTLSAHNKLVYSPPQPNGRIGAALEKHYVAFCEQNKNNNAAWMKGAGSNRIYTAFNKALESIGLVVGCRVPSWNWDFFRAKIEGNETIYRLTNTVVTAINMSWAAKPVSLNEPSLKGVTVTVGDAVCDFQAFDYLIKKYCGRLWGKVEQDSGFANLSLEKNSTQIDPRTSLIVISNEQSDLTVLASYYNEILEKHPEKIPLIVDKLKSINPSGGGENYNYDVKEANKLFQKLFHCTLEQFYSNPHQRAIVPPRIVTLEIPYEYGHDGKSRSHFHQVKYKGNEPDLQGKTGDVHMQFYKNLKMK